MGKSLQVFSNNLATTATGRFGSIFGSGSGATSGVAQFYMRVSGTFSKLGFNNLGGSGANTVTIRIAGTNGNNIVTRTGTGWQEDSTSVDVIFGTELINLPFTDTGTDPTYNPVKILFQAHSIHTAQLGCSSAATTYDLPSVTQFIGFFGPPIADGVVTEANTQLKNRGGTLLRNFQVRVSANARTNSSDFRTRINGANGNGLVQFAAGVTGIVVDDTNTDVLADGTLFNASITLDTGVEDLNVTGVSVLAQNINSPKNDLALYTSSARAASATANYMALGGNNSLTATTTEASTQLQPGFRGRVMNLRCYVSANTYTGSATLTLRKNGAALISLSISALATGWQENTVDVGTFEPTDSLNYEIVGGTLNSITIESIVSTIEDMLGRSFPFSGMSIEGSGAERSFGSVMG